MSIPNERVASDSTSFPSSFGSHIFPSSISNCTVGSRNESTCTTAAKLPTSVPLVSSNLSSKQVSVSPSTTITTSSSRSMNSLALSEAHTCPYVNCGKSFSKKYNLKAHLRLHTGELPFVCDRPNCKKKFKWRSSLSSHAVWHSRKDSVSKNNSCNATNSSNHIPSVNLKIATKSRNTTSTLTSALRPFIDDYSSSINTNSDSKNNRHESKPRINHSNPSETQTREATKANDSDVDKPCWKYLNSPKSIIKPPAFYETKFGLPGSILKNDSSSEGHGKNSRFKRGRNIYEGLTLPSAVPNTITLATTYLAAENCRNLWTPRTQQYEPSSKKNNVIPNMKDSLQDREVHSLKNWSNKAVPSQALHTSSPISAFDKNSFPSKGWHTVPAQFTEISSTLSTRSSQSHIKEYNGSSGLASNEKPGQDKVKASGMKTENNAADNLCAHTLSDYANHSVFDPLCLLPISSIGYRNSNPALIETPTASLAVKELKHRHTFPFSSSNTSTLDATEIFNPLHSPNLFFREDHDHYQIHEGLYDFNAADTVTHAHPVIQPNEVVEESFFASLPLDFRLDGLEVESLNASENVI